MAYEKHVGIYQTYEDFEKDMAELKLVAPWVAYVPNGENGYNMIYSNDMVIKDTEFNAAEILGNRVNNLEKRMISLTEEEYEALIKLEKGASMIVTAPDGTQQEVSYNPTTYYCTYDPSDLGE